MGLLGLYESVPGCSAFEILHLHFVLLSTTLMALDNLFLAAISLPAFSNSFCTMIFCGLQYHVIKPVECCLKGSSRKEGLRDVPANEECGLPS